MDANDIRRLARQTGYDPATLEKDYALTWLIAAIYAADSPLRTYLVFKGGTALRKVYLPEWRLSEDLDFTIVGKPDPKVVRKDFDGVLKRLREASGIAYAFTSFHVSDFAILGAVQFLGPLGFKNTIQLDISRREPLADEPARVSVRPEYGIGEFEAVVYSMDELLAEKIRSIMQRGKARDYYDVWRLFREKRFDSEIIRNFVLKKCEGVRFAYDPGLVFDDARLEDARRFWEPALGRLTKDLPDFDRVIADLRTALTFLNDI